MTFLSFLGTVAVVATFIYEGYNDIINPVGGAKCLQNSYLNTTLKIAGASRQPTPKELELVSQAIGGILIACSTLAIVGLLRCISGITLALFVLIKFFLKNIDISKPITPALFKGKEEMLLQQALVLGACLLIATSGCKHTIAKKLKKD